MRRMGIGLGIGINRSNYAQGIFNAYQSRVIADGGVTEAGACVDAVSGLLLTASLLLIPSGYKSGKAYAQIPTNGNGDLTWTRASDAWRTNADGLIQRVPWNLLEQSEDFSNAYWIKTNSTITANSTTAPNGTNTADKLIPNTVLTFHNVSKTLSIATLGQYTISIYAKKGEYSGLRINYNTSGESFISINLDTGVIASFGGTIYLSSSITNVGNEWYRITMSVTSPSGSNSINYIVENPVGVTNFVGNAVNGIFIWGAQLVEGSSAQTYFPTTDRLNVPRLSYMYGSCPALLLEPQRTNLCLNSNGIGGTSWGSASGGVGVAPTVTLNYATSPDGTNNASRLQLSLGGGTTTTDQSLVTQTLTGIACRGSFYIKTTDGSTKTIYLRGSSATNVVVTGTWTRYDFDAGTLTGTQFGLGLRGGQTQTNSNTADILVWGAQLEVGAYATTLIPTTTASATRVADSFSRNNIYTNGLITSSGGTWFVELRNNIAYVRDTTQRLGVGDGSSLSNDAIFLIALPSLSRLQIYKSVAGALSAVYTTTATTCKIAIKWNGTSADIFENGTKVVSATSFTPTNMDILTNTSTGVPTFIQAMALYPTPLSDANCIALTT